MLTGVIFRAITSLMLIALCSLGFYIYSTRSR